MRTLLCFDPTRGIDIRTKREIYHLLRELADAGSAVLLYTSELEEVSWPATGPSSSSAVVVVDEMPASVADEPTLMRAAYGLPRETGERRHRSPRRAQADGWPGRSA